MHIQSICFLNLFIDGCHPRISVDALLVRKVDLRESSSSTQPSFFLLYLNMDPAYIPCITLWQHVCPRLYKHSPSSHSLSMPPWNLPAQCNACNVTSVFLLRGGGHQRNTTCKSYTRRNAPPSVPMPCHHTAKFKYQIAPKRAPVDNDTVQLPTVQKSSLFSLSPVMPRMLPLITVLPAGEAFVQHSSWHIRRPWTREGMCRWQPRDRSEAALARARVDGACQALLRSG